MKRDGIKVMTNRDVGFYEIMGPIFGSRSIQSVTGDRFYDDDDKIWYLHYTGDIMDAVVSVKRQ